MPVQELRVADLMTRSVYTLTSTQSLSLAESLMGLKHIRHVPVVDAGGRVIGLVTHRDLLAAKISALSPLSADERSTLELSVPVSKVMRTEVWTIHPDALAINAVRIMRDHAIGCLPVLNDGLLVGILTEADLLGLVTDSLSLERPAPPWTVERAMTCAPVTIHADTTIADARAVMSRYAIRHLPVLDGDQPITMVSERELRVAEAVFREASRTPALHSVRLLGMDPVRRIAHDAPLDEVLDEMFHDRLEAVLVLKEGRLVGILSASDACRLLAEQVRPRRDAQTVRAGASFATASEGRDGG
jgi:CBS domain-containing membrane protein